MRFEKMELKDKDASVSDDDDDEEDLEQLRLAALQSLRKPAVANNAGVRAKPKKSPQSLNNRGRGFQGRNTRNGQFGNRSRNTNLISIPTVQTEDFIADTTTPAKKLKFSDNVTVSKLILPQDRYCNVKATEEKSAEPVSKFDRYDNSDKSESETENEFESDSENECAPSKLERASSLEALMQELENEIQGDSKPKEDKVKKRGKKRKRKANPDSTQNENEEDDACVTVGPEVAETPSTTADNIIVLHEKDKVAESKFDKIKNRLDNEEKAEEEKISSHLQRSVGKPRSAMQRRSPVYDRYKRQQYYDPLPKVNYPQQNVYPPLVFSQNISSPFNNQPVHFRPVLPYNSQFSVGGQVPPPAELQQQQQQQQHNFIPSFSERSLSPLLLNTDDALTIARAPLSPRSAAFVLQNREIIERRKKSPRRSYSRSPSPRYRRSKSPRNYNTRSPPTLAHQKLIKLSRSLSPNPQRFSPNYEKGLLSSAGEKKLSPLREKRSPPPNREKYVSPPRERKHSPPPPPYRPKRPSPPRDKKISPIRDAKLRDKKISPARDRKSPIRERRPSPLRDKKEDYSSPNRRKSPVLNEPASAKQNYRGAPPSKTSIRDRLGSRAHFSQSNESKNNSRTQQSEQRKVKKCTPSPEPSPSPKEPLESKQNYLDPILEARRRKFESNEIKNTEGIIRLKPKTESPPKPTSEAPAEENILNEEQELLEIEPDILNTKVDDLFSDDETDEENEGRFKSHAQLHKRNVSVLPFTQLLGNSAHNVKNEGLSSQDRSENENENRKRDRRKNSSAKDRRERGGSSNHRTTAKTKTAKSTSTSTGSKSDNVKSGEQSERKDKPGPKNRLMYRSEVKRDKVLVTAPIESKKIEIKIRNPSKYETTSKYDVANEHEMERVSRKIEAVTKGEEIEEDDLNGNEPEIIIDNEDANADADLIPKSEGDLRAQLSRKRAERQNKLPVAEDVQSRLLQSALQGAVFKKPKKSKKSKEPVPKDGKLPIHLRLGFANDLDTFEETVSHKKNRKSKSSGGLEQV